MNLIFMGTPAFAVPALKALIGSPHKVAAVYSQPPRPAGRGQKEAKSPVHQLAEAHGIPVFTPASLKPEEAQERFAAHHADAAIVAAYGLLLPRPILEGAKRGCINLHPSLLPRWRGAAPIQRSIMAGDTETAMCLMQMNEGLDTGDILTMKKLAIPGDWNAGKLHDAMAELGATLLLKTLEALQAGKVNAAPQSSEGVTYARKITKEEAHIDWTKSAQDIHNLIRGLSPHPGAYALLNGEMIKILDAAHDAQATGKPPGEVVDQHLRIACGSGSLQPLLVQRAGKKAMPVEEMLRGFSITAGTLLT